MRITYLVEVFSYFNFHVVGYTLVFLDTCVKLGKLRIVFLQKKFPHHTKHSLHTLGETGNLLLCLQNRKFGSLHEACRNEMQTEVFLLVGLPAFDDPTYKTLNLRNEPNQNKGVDHIKTSVESS